MSSSSSAQSIIPFANLTGPPREGKPKPDCWPPKCMSTHRHGASEARLVGCDDPRDLVETKDRVRLWREFFDNDVRQKIVPALRARGIAVESIHSGKQYLVSAFNQQVLLEREFVDTRECVGEVDLGFNAIWQCARTFPDLAPLRDYIAMMQYCAPGQVKLEGRFIPTVEWQGKYIPNLPWRIPASEGGEKYETAMFELGKDLEGTMYRKRRHW